MTVRHNFPGAVLFSFLASKRKSLEFIHQKKKKKGKKQKETKLKTKEKLVQGDLYPVRFSVATKFRLIHWRKKSSIEGRK